MLKKCMSRLLVVGVFAFLMVLLGCSLDNPIEIENGKNPVLSFDRERLEIDVENADYYACVAKYGAIRCKTFNQIFGSFDCEEIADTNYNDAGEIITPVSSSSEETQSSSSVTVPYLLKNMNLKITLRNYKQLTTYLSEKNYENNPEIRFAVKFFADGMQVRVAESEEYTVSPVLLNGINIKEWSGKHGVTVPIARGIDEVHLCPIVMNINEIDDEEEPEEGMDFENPEDEDVSSGACYSVKEIGRLTHKVDQKDVSEIYEMSWEMELYE